MNVSVTHGHLGGRFQRRHQRIHHLCCRQCEQHGHHGRGGRRRVRGDETFNAACSAAPPAPRSARPAPLARYDDDDLPADHAPNTAATARSLGALGATRDSFRRLRRRFPILPTITASFTGIAPEPDGMSADGDVRVYGPNGTTELGSSTGSGSSNETINLDDLPTGTYYAKLTRPNNGQYLLHADTGCPAAAAEDQHRRSQRRQERGPERHHALHLHSDAQWQHRRGIVGGLRRHPRQHHGGRFQRRGQRHPHLPGRRNQQDHPPRTRWPYCFQDDQGFTVVLSGASGATLGTATAAGVIRDDDPPADFAPNTWATARTSAPGRNGPHFQPLCRHTRRVNDYYTFTPDATRDLRLSRTGWSANADAKLLAADGLHGQG